jgi:hypothetical protein
MAAAQDLHSKMDVPIRLTAPQLIRDKTGEPKYLLHLAEVEWLTTESL